MDDERNNASTRTAAPAQTQRRPWSRPRVARMRAGEAELSPTGAGPDGPFSSGS
jgi:hypothetical protein